MFDPIQYTITMEGNTEYSVNKRRSILDNIEDKYPGTIESEINSFKKAANNIVKAMEDVIKRANIPGIAVYFDTKMFEEIDSLSLLPPVYVDKMESLQKYLENSEDYDRLIDGQYIVFTIYTFTASNTQLTKAAAKYGSDKNPKSSSSGNIDINFSSFVDNLYNKLKGNANFLGVSYTGDWNNGVIDVYLKPSSKFISIARKCGY